METKKEKIGVYSVEQKKLFLQERISDSMAIVQNGFRRVWRPNNYRRQINVKIKSDSTIENINSAISNVSIGKRNKLLFVEYKGVKLQYGNSTLTGIYSQRVIGGEKEVFVFEASSVDVLSKAIEEKKEEIRRLIDEALFSFIRKFNIGLVGEVPIWSRHEDWTVDEEIKKIPEWTIIHGEHFKKVYPEGVEFVGGKDSEPTSQLINRVRNSGLNDFSPIIVDELVNLEMSLNPLSFLKRNVKGVGDVIKNKGAVIKLTELEKLEFETWLITAFGVGCYNA